MKWKIATVVLAVALSATIGLGEWQISHQWSRTVNSEASLFTVVRGNQVSADRSISSLRSQTESAIATVSGATVGGITRLIGSTAIGSPTLTGAIGNLQREVSCLETDITDIENQSTTYLNCN